MLACVERPQTLSALPLSSVPVLGVRAHSRGSLLRARLSALQRVQDGVDGCARGTSLDACNNTTTQQVGWERVYQCILAALPLVSPDILIRNAAHQRFPCHHAALSLLFPGSSLVACVAQPKHIALHKDGSQQKHSALNTDGQAGGRGSLGSYCTIVGNPLIPNRSPTAVYIHAYT